MLKLAHVDGEVVNERTDGTGMSQVKGKVGGGLKQIPIGPIAYHIATGEGTKDGVAPEVAAAGSDHLEHLKEEGGLTGAAGASQDADLPSGQKSLYDLAAESGLFSKGLYDGPPLEGPVTGASAASKGAGKYWTESTLQKFVTSVGHGIHPDYSTPAFGGANGPGGGKMMVKLKSLQGELDTKAMTALDMLSLVGDFMFYNSGEGKRLWDLLVAMRGPDVGYDPGLPGVKGAALIDFEDGRNPTAKKLREQRKLATGAILRARMFPKGLQGNMKLNPDPSAVVSLPPKGEWDHYDQHVAEACQILEIPYSIGGKVVNSGDISLEDIESADPFILEIPAVAMKQYYQGCPYQMLRVKKWDAAKKNGSLRVQSDSYTFTYTSAGGPLHMTSWLVSWYRGGSQVYARMTGADPMNSESWYRVDFRTAEALVAYRHWDGSMPEGQWEQDPHGRFTWRQE